LPRVVVLGCGTGVGKTRVSVALLRELTGGHRTCVGLKPIESGVPQGPESPATGTDARALAEAGSFQTQAQHPLYALPTPVSPHLAARTAGIEIALPRVARWVEEIEEIESRMTLHVLSDSVIWSVVETAGGVFSPLSPATTNYDLACALEPAIWVLVGADALGVLHELSATLQAMRARGRVPDRVVLSAARESDASTGSNARELSALGIVTPTAVLGRNDDRGIRDLVQSLLASEAETA
jgi:dethiobiotin synthetase